jgi:hypothetical protein
VSDIARLRGRLSRVAGIILVAASPWACPGTASAQGGFGLHGGATIDPDQGFLGMHYITNPLTGDLRVHPGADVGFGDDLTLASLHVDFVQWFELNPRWHLYFGGGPAVNIYRFETGRDDTATEVEGGFDTLVGFAHETGWTLEMRVGSSGSPDLRFAVGFTFK